MRATTLSAVRMFLVAAAIGAIGCGGSKSPGAPSASPLTNTAALPSPTGGSTAGATISGIVIGGMVGAARLHTQSVGMTVTVAGTSLSSPVDASGAFSLRGVPTGTVRLLFSANGTSAPLDVNDVVEHQEIHVTVVVGPAAAQVEDDVRETPDNRVEIEGRITASSGATLRVADKDVSVPAGTPIRHGGTALTLADLHVGDRIHVRGMKSGGMIVATSIEAQTSNPTAPTTGDDHGSARAEVNGTIAGKTGTCPALAFTIGATKVTTNAATTFEDTTCSAIANGMTAEAKGTRQTDGSILASKVEAKATPGAGDKNEAELKGAIAGKAGTCPALTFTIGGTSVVTNASTQFKDGSCSALANGVSVEVKGTRQAGGSVLARSVEAKH